LINPTFLSGDFFWKELISQAREKEAGNMVLGQECVQETEEIFLKGKEEKAENLFQFKF